MDGDTAHETAGIASGSRGRINPAQPALSFVPSAGRANPVSGMRRSVGPSQDSRSIPHTTLAAQCWARHASSRALLGQPAAQLSPLSTSERRIASQTKRGLTLRRREPGNSPEPETHSPLQRRARGRSRLLPSRNRGSLGHHNRSGRHFRIGQTRSRWARPTGPAEFAPFAGCGAQVEAGKVGPLRVERRSSRFAASATLTRPETRSSAAIGMSPEESSW